MTNKQYANLTKRESPKSNVLIDCVNAFWTGGLICVLGQLLYEAYELAQLDVFSASSCVSMTLVAIAVILTALNIYPKIAKFAGAGTLVPITGFANAVAAPAIEFKTEGHILGIGAKMFTIAGPVIVFGIISSFVYGVILYVITLI